jgi:hypothetical protein
MATHEVRSQASSGGRQASEESRLFGESPGAYSRPDSGHVAPHVGKGASQPASIRRDQLDLERLGGATGAGPIPPSDRADSRR